MVGGDDNFFWGGVVPACPGRQQSLCLVIHEALDGDLRHGSTTFPIPLFQGVSFISPSLTTLYALAQNFSSVRHTYSNSWADLGPESCYIKDFIFLFYYYYFFNCSMVEAALEGFLRKTTWVLRPPVRLAQAVLGGDGGEVQTDLRPVLALLLTA